jgi:hypothetical protein
MNRAALAIAAAVLAAAGTFVAGRATAPDSTPRAASARRVLESSPAYLAGREDAFSGFDGGRIIGDPYTQTTRPWRMVFSVTTRGSTNWSR